MMYSKEDLNISIVNEGCEGPRITCEGPSIGNPERRVPCLTEQRIHILSHWLTKQVKRGRQTESSELTA